MMIILVVGFSVQAVGMNLKAAHTLPPEHPIHKALLKFADEVEKNTDGAITIDVFPAAQLGNERELVEGIMFGTLDFAFISPGAISLFQPEFGVFDCPYIFRDEEHLKKVVNGKVGEELYEKLEKNRGMKLISPFMLYGTRHLTTKNTPVRKPEDTKGLLIRCPEQPIYLETVKAFGATATPVAFSDLYMALKQGTVDGQENPIPTIYSYKYYEAQNYINLTGHMIRVNMGVCNAAWFNNLSEERKEIVTDAIKVAEDYNAQLINKQQTELLKKLKEKGMTVVKPDIEAFREACSNVYKEFEDEWGNMYQKIKAVK